MATATAERKRTRSGGITLNLDEFFAAVKTAGHAVPSRAANPSLLNLRVGNGCVSGTDLDYRIDVEMPGLDCEPMLLPKDRLHRILQNLKAARCETVTLQPSGSTCIIKSDRCEWRLPTEDASTYPEWDVNGLHVMFTMPGDEFGRAARSVMYAIDKDSSRYALGGVFIECVDDNVWFVATDGRRMSIAKSRRENATDDFVLEPKGHQKPSPIVPVNPLTQLINCATGTSEVVIRWANGVLRGTVGNVTITTKLISGRFANWRVVLGEGKLPDGHSVVRSDLRTATAAAKVVTTESSKGVLFTFADDALTLSAKSSEAGESEVQCPIDSMADPCRVKLNPHYVEQFLRPFTEDSHPCVVFHVLPGDGKTVLTVGDQYTGIIMPLAE